MADIIVTARIIPHSNGTFGVVVWSALAKATDEVVTTELETGEAETRQRAEIVQSRLIGVVVGRSHRQGHNVLKVKRVELPPSLGPLGLHVVPRPELGE